MIMNANAKGQDENLMRLSHANLGEFDNLKYNSNEGLLLPTMTN